MKKINNERSELSLYVIRITILNDKFRGHYFRVFSKVFVKRLFKELL